MNLADINDIWNRRIIALPEPVGRDVWQTPSETIALGTGDCEDFAIGKYFTAINRGWGTLAEVLTVKLSDGRAHCIMAHGGWALDNLVPNITHVTHRIGAAGAILYRSTVADPQDPRFKALIERIDEVETLRAINDFLKRK